MFWTTSGDRSNTPHTVSSPSRRQSSYQGSRTWGVTLLTWLPGEKNVQGVIHTRPDLLITGLASYVKHFFNKEKQSKIGIQQVQIMTIFWFLKKGVNNCPASQKLKKCLAGYISLLFLFLLLCLCDYHDKLTDRLFTLATLYCHIIFSQQGEFF